jgi:hypothetical protein
MFKNIKKLMLLSLVALTTTVVYGMEEKKGPTFENFEKLPEDLKIEVLYQHIKNFIDESVVTQAEYELECKRIRELPESDKSLRFFNKKTLMHCIKKPGDRKQVIYNEVVAELNRLRQTNKEFKKIIDGDKFKAKIKPLLKERFGK